MKVLTLKRQRRTHKLPSTLISKLHSMNLSKVIQSLNQNKKKKNRVIDRKEI
jgi:hypothetical protein